LTYSYKIFFQVCVHPELFSDSAVEVVTVRNCHTY